MFKGFKSSIIGFFVSLMVITIAGIMANNYYLSKQAVFDVSTQILDSNTNHMMDLTANLMETVHHNLELLSTVVNEHDLQKDQKKLLKYLWQINQQSKFYSSTYVADPTGRFLQAYKEPSLGTRVINPSNKKQEQHIYYKDDYTQIANLSRPTTYNPLVRPWYTDTSNQSQIHWTELYVFSSTQQLGITASIPVLDAQGKKKAVIGIDISLTRLSQFISHQSVRRQSVMMIVNRQHQIMAMSNKLQFKKLVGKESKTIPTMSELKDVWINDVYRAKLSELSSSSEENYHITVNKKRYFTKLTSLSHDWVLLIILPENLLLEHVNKNIADTITISIIFLIIAVISIFLIATHLSGPVSQLAQNAQLIQAYRFQELKPNNCQIAEIKAMDQSLMDMRDSLIAFDKYVPTELVKQIVNGHYSLELGGSEKPITLFISGVDCFAENCLQLDAHQQAYYLIRYQDEVSRILIHEHATISTYMSDIIMAFWGAPEPHSNSPQVACRVALECRQAMTNLNRKLRSDDLPPLTNHIALHFADMIVGNFGSEHHMMYSAIGHQADFCLMLESLNQRYGTHIIITEPTYNAIKKDFCCRWLDSIVPPYDSVPIKIYELVGWLDDPLSIELEPFIRQYEQALDHFQNQQIDAAQTILQELTQIHAHDGAVNYLLSKIKEATHG